MKKIERKYSAYHNDPQKHPKFKIEWNNFWYENAYKMKNAASAAESELNEKWAKHWKRRVRELEAEEFLEARITIREQMQLPQDPLDEARWKKIEMRSRNQPEDNSPAEKLENVQEDSSSATVSPAPLRRCIVDLNELLTNIRPHINDSPQPIDRTLTKTLHYQEVIQPVEERAQAISNYENDSPSQGTAHSMTSKDESNSSSSGNFPTNMNDQSSEVQAEVVDQPPKETKDPDGTLTNEEVLELFGFYDSLDPDVVDQLFNFMKQLETNDPERHKLLTSYKFSTAANCGDESETEGEMEVTCSEDSLMDVPAADISDPPPKQSVDETSLTYSQSIANVEQSEDAEIEQPEAVQAAEPESENTGVNDPQPFNETSSTRSHQDAEIEQPEAGQAGPENTEVNDPQPAPKIVVLSMETLKFAEEDDDEDDYPLENSDMIEKAKQNAEIITIESDEEETVEIASQSSDDDCIQVPNIYNKFP